MGRVKGREGCGDDAPEHTPEMSSDLHIICMFCLAMFCRTGSVKPDGAGRGVYVSSTFIDNEGVAWPHPPQIGTSVCKCKLS